MTSFTRTCIGMILFALATATAACSAESSDSAGSNESNQTASSGRAEVYRGDDGQHYFRLIAANGEPVLRSEGYASREAAVSGVDAALEYARSASASGAVKRAGSGEFFFNLVAANGQIIGTSQLYSEQASANRGLETVKRIAQGSVDRSDAQTGARFDVWKREADGQHFFRLVATNGETVLHSHGYAQRSGVKRGISAVRRTGELPAHYEVLEAVAGQFYFVLKSPNGRVIANSELYSRRESAEAGVRAVTEILQTLSVPGEDTATGPATCADLPGGYWELFEDSSWRVVSETEWELGAQLSELQKAQLLAAVNVSAGSDISTIEAAFDRVDQGVVNYVVLQKGGKKYAAVEYGAGDNSFGAIFEATSPTPLAENVDGDIECGR